MYYHESEWKALEPILWYPIRFSVKTILVIGAHRFDEKDKIDEVFTSLENIICFEPIKELCLHVLEKNKKDLRVRCLPYAVSDYNSRELLTITDNDGASSTICDFTTHAERFPDIKIKEVREVDVHTLQWIYSRHLLPWPDALFIDAEGCEAKILKSEPPDLMEKLKFIFVECSKEPIYDEATFDTIYETLSPSFKMLSWVPIEPEVPTHGNSLYICKQFYEEKSYGR